MREVLTSDSRVVVAGNSLAGISAVRALRSEGFAGSIVMIGGDPDARYDRPPLSKEFLVGAVEARDIRLWDEAELSTLGVQLLPDNAAALNDEERRVFLDSGDSLEFDFLFICTGARPRLIGDLHQDSLPARVHVLRSASHALSLGSQMTKPGHRLLIVGAGFLGSEVASSARRNGSTVRMVESGPHPMCRVVGNQVGEWLGRLQESAGIDLRTSTQVATLNTVGDQINVTLTSGEELVADSVALCIGAIPEVDWLRGSSLQVDDGVRCDSALFASPAIVAAGDVASWWSDQRSAYVRLEHWTSAVEQARLAASNLMVPRNQATPFQTLGYFWSDQFGRRIERVGICGADVESEPIWGRMTDDSFVVGLFENGALCAAVGVNAGPQMLKIRRALRRGDRWPDAARVLVDQTV